MSYRLDTIAAIATAPGTGAVSLLRVSGSEAVDYVGRLWRGRAALVDSPERRANLGGIVNLSGELVDQVLATVFRGPRSYTGEDVVELACHGGVLVTSELLKALLSVGCRLADPGEFSQRAFFNGKMDLTQAEAVMDLISAQTTLALRAAHGQLDGRLGQTITKMRAELLHVLAHVEAYTDFPEEDISPGTVEQLRQLIAAILQQAHSLLATADQGRILREGVNTVLCGLPNAGKSSLLNTLLGYDRAIVSATPGTTRDTIEEVINLRGYPLRLVDTAGVRATTDELEQAGVERSQRQLLRADLILEVVDASESAQQRLEMGEGATGRRLLVLNKLDLGVHPSWDSVAEPKVAISCQNGDGLASLEDAILQAITQGVGLATGSQVAINARHQDCLRRVVAGLVAGDAALQQEVSSEFVAMDLRDAMDALGEITGRMDTEELLGAIFSQFCIGK